VPKSLLLSVKQKNGCLYESFKVVNLQSVLSRTLIYRYSDKFLEVINPGLAGF